MRCKDEMKVIRLGIKHSVLEALELTVPYRSYDRRKHAWQQFPCKLNSKCPQNCAVVVRLALSFKASRSPSFRTSFANGGISCLFSALNMVMCHLSNTLRYWVVDTKIGFSLSVHLHNMYLDIISKCISQSNLVEKLTGFRSLALSSGNHCKLNNHTKSGSNLAGVRSMDPLETWHITLGYWNILPNYRIELNRATKHDSHKRELLKTESWKIEIE